MSAGVRVMVAPFVVAPPSGVRVRTRLLVDDTDAQCWPRSGAISGPWPELTWPDAARRAVWRARLPLGWYLDASWKTPVTTPPTLDRLRAGRVAAVDLNSGHLAAVIADASGNLVGGPVTIPTTSAVASSQRLTAGV